MHEGMNVSDFDSLKGALPANGADAKLIPWWTLSDAQFKEINTSLGMMVKPVAQNLWKDPDYYRKVALTDVDTSVLARNLTSATSRLGWFLYFLKEASLRNDKTPQQGAELLTIMQRYLRKTAGGDGVEFKAPMDGVDAAQLRTDLTALLKIGFSALCGFGQGHEQDDCSDATLLQFKRSGQVYQDVDFRWRADSRDFEAIKQTLGFQTKANSEGYAKASGMRDPYHPFSDPAIRKYLWFRRGQTDNCLYTVVSVGKGTDWKGYLPFPKIEASLPKELFVKEGRAPISPNYRERYAMCKAGGKTKSILLPVTAWLYMFLLTGLVVETNRIQQALDADAFPEEGVQEIPLGDIFGAIKFYRFHHGVTDDDGFTAIPEKGGVIQFRNPQFQDTKYSRKGFEMLEREFAAVAGAAGVSVKWTANGYSEKSPKFTFKGEEIEIIELSPQR